MLPLLYHAHLNRHLEDLPFWLDLAAQMGDPVLELGCGTGRVLLPLAQAGHRVMGVDHNPAMLRFLQANIGLQNKPTPMLIIGDLSRFNLAAKFPLIILPCNTFSTLPKNKRLACLECVHKHLRSGGVFSLSIPNPELLKNLPVQSEAEVEDEFILPQTGNPVQVSSCWRRSEHTFKVTWIYDQLVPDGRVERLTVNTTHQMVPVETYLGEIRSAGMRVNTMYGDYDRSAFQEDSPNMICMVTI
jgi:SAM-dependent methyltransferase